MLTIDERYDLFKSTVIKCGSDILSKNDIDFRYILFEELSVDIVSYLYSDSLDVFVQAGYIDEEIYDKCVELREIFMREEHSFLLLSDVEKIKVSAAFSQIVNLADEIMRLIRNR